MSNVLDDISLFQNKLQAYEINVLSKQQQKASIEIEIVQVNKTIDELKAKAEKYKKAVIFLQRFSEKRREAGQEIFSDMGTSALQNIFGDGWALDISYDVKRSKAVANVNIISPYADDESGQISYSSTFAAGGENDVISFAMKVALLQAYKPKQEGPILLDETFKHVSANHIEDLVEFLSQISQRLNRQFIFCTSHRHPSLNACADKSFLIQRESDQKSIVIEDD